MLPYSVLAIYRKGGGNFTYPIALKVRRIRRSNGQQLHSDGWSGYRIPGENSMARVWMSPLARGEEPRGIFDKTDMACLRPCLLSPQAF